MRLRRSASSLLWLFAAPTRSTPADSSAFAIERVVINDNRVPAGVLRNGALTIHLEAREADWRPDGDSQPGLVVRVFAEQGKRALVPGPLIRVPAGTEIHAFVRNTLARGTLVVHGLSRRGVTADTSADTIQVSPGATRDVRFVAGAPGTYYYQGTIEGAPNSDPSSHDAELSGAFIVDPAGAAPPRDRVFVIALWAKDAALTGRFNPASVLRFTINGNAWPKTEHLSYALGDTVRFRLINVSSVPHPMHLHGFFFNVDSRGNGAVDSVYDRTTAPYRVVTERLAPGRTFSMTWVPERAGNWMFHCHDNYHVLRSRPFDGSPLPAEQLVHTMNHARDMMGGLVMGIEVRGREAPAVVAQGGVRRKLRLVARVDSGTGREPEPAFGYVLQDGATSLPPRSPLLPGPTILLKRGEPVSIMVVNELPEATSVHWHGIELESYYDGVAGFAGSTTHIAPAIAPRDSFEARFTPPRSGTFIYHPHADELRQQTAGLSGALVVVDAPATFDPSHDIVVLLSVPRLEADSRVILLNGSATPAPREMHVGERYRLRIVDIHTYRPSMIVRLMRDSTLATWRAIAKDGMDLPAQSATARPAQQQMGNGETYDFEFSPTTSGDYRLTVSGVAGALLVSMPIRVR